MVFRGSGLVNDSIVDGPGFRFAVFTQGCPHNCEGCHNPQTHDPKGGYDIDTDAVLAQIKANPLLDGITLTGGEPFMQATELLPLAKAVKEQGLSVLAYSGFTFEELLVKPDCVALLSYCDILIDGRFELKGRSLELRFRGSVNQRILDVQQSLAAGKAVLHSLYND